MIISLREIPNCFAIWEGGSKTLPYGWSIANRNAKRQFTAGTHLLKYTLKTVQYAKKTVDFLTELSEYDMVSKLNWNILFQHRKEKKITCAMLLF